MAGYGVGRFLIEGIRTDAATEILGIRVNHWMSGTAIAFSVLALLFAYRNALPSFWAGATVDVDSGSDDKPSSDEAATTS